MRRVSEARNLIIGLMTATVLVVGCKNNATSGADSGRATGGGGASGTGGTSSSGGTTTPSGSGGAQGSGGTSIGTGGQSTSPTGGAGSGGALAASGGNTAGTGDAAAGGTAGASGGTGGASGTGGGGGRDAGTGADAYPPAPTTFDNPIIKYDAPDPTAGPGKNIFTADGASMVWNDKVYLYVDRDDAAVGANGYVISDWLLYVTSDMVHWESKGSVANCKSFSWCTGGPNGGAAAPQVIERDDKDGKPKFYLYGPVNDGSAIGVLVADKPEGPFKDARGIPLIYSADTANMGATHSWRNLDPTVIVDDSGQAYLAWGNKIYFWTMLEDDMIHLKGETYTTDANGKMQNRNLGTAKINAQTQTGDWSDYTEAPWLSKHGNLYYLTYASAFPETISYATSASPAGPWQHRGVVIDRADGDPSTLHPALFDFHGASYLGYHDATLPTGSDYRRSQCMDRVYYNTDGTLRKMVRTHK